MSQLGRLGRNMLWLLLARIGTQGFMVLFTILVARRLGEAGFGEYAFVASAMFLANVMTTFGTDMWLIREIAAGQGLSQLPGALATQLALSTLVVVLVFVGAPSLPNQSRDVALALQIHSLSLFPLAFYTVFTAALRGRELMAGYTLLSLVVAVLQVTGIGLFVWDNGNVVTVAGVLLAVQLIAAVLAGLICVQQIQGFTQAWKISAVRLLLPVVRASMPMALLGVLGMAYQKLGIYMLSTLEGPAPTGWFAAALRIVEASKTGHLALFGALYPAMSRQRSGKVEEAQWAKANALSWRLLLLVASAGSLILFGMSESLVQLAYGPPFAQAVPALRILVWLLIPYTINTYLSLALIAAKRERAVGQALAISLLVSAVLSTWWIPLAGLIGACWAALAAELAQLAALLCVRKANQIRPVLPNETGNVL